MKVSLHGFSLCHIIKYGDEIKIKWSFSINSFMSQFPILATTFNSYDQNDQKYDCNETKSFTMIVSPGF